MEKQVQFAAVFEGSYCLGICLETGFVYVMDGATIEQKNSKNNHIFYAFKQSN